MSTPSSHRPACGSTHSPLTSSTPSRASSFVEPKNEYLRNVLKARRAKDATPTPSPAERRPPPPPLPPSMQRRVTSNIATTDPWVEQAVSEEDIPPVPTYRRVRRPSEGGTPRLPTQRELQAETESLRTTMFDLNLKLELLKKQNNELKDAVDEANKRIDDLEPLEDANLDLREENDRLTLRLHNLEDDNAKLEDETIELRNHNKEVLQIQEETVTQLEQLQRALEEAADVIIRSEAANAELKEENLRLKEEISSSRSSGEYYSADAAADLVKKPPSRIYSIDEARPSTSHFHSDSDYYSQPASPHAEPKKLSREGLRFSDRAKDFLEMNINGRRSIQELKKRVSDISVKQAARQKSAVPEVPRIPEQYATEQAPRSVKRTPGRKRTLRVQPGSVDGSHTYVPSLAPPRTPTGHKDGLRELYRQAQSSERSRPSSKSSSMKSPAISKASRGSDLEQNPFFNPPPRQSSRHAQTSSSNEQLRSNPDMSASEMAPELPPPPSIISDDLTADGDRREQWWKDIEHYPGQRVDNRTAVSMASRAMEGGASSRRQPSMGADFLFNMAENEDQFMQRAHQSMSRRR